MFLFTDKSVGSNDIERSDAENSFGREDLVLLENLSRNGHGRVDRIRDDADESVGTRLRDRSAQISHNGGVHVEQIIASHARLAWHTSWYDHNVAALECVLQLGGAYVCAHLALGLDMAQICRYAFRVLHVVQRQVIDQRRLLEQERQRLANATTCAQYRYFSLFTKKLDSIFKKLFNLKKKVSLPDFEFGTNLGFATQRRTRFG